MRKSRRKRARPSLQPPLPKVVLFPPGSVSLGWAEETVGSGFINVGNTCYLNSTVQALFHLPSFFNWLHSPTLLHLSECRSTKCLICTMHEILTSCQLSNSPVNPIKIHSNLNETCKKFPLGEQEDAHEFLRYLLEGMERAYLETYIGPAIDIYSKDTTALSQIFGGYLRTEVTCLKCQYVSTSFQYFQELVLDINTVSSVDGALKCFFQPEQLGNEKNKFYNCEQCKTEVVAQKKFSLERPPKALCIVLKLFGANGKKKMLASVRTAEVLNLDAYISQPRPTGLLYELSSLINHEGSTAVCGHYTTIIKTLNGNYYRYNDTKVCQISIRQAFNSTPYILFYEAKKSSFPTIIKEKKRRQTSPVMPQLKRVLFNKKKRKQTSPVMPQLKKVL